MSQPHLLPGNVVCANRIPAIPEVTGVFLRHDRRGAGSRGTWVAIWKAGCRITHVAIPGLDENSTRAEALLRAKSTVPSW